MNKSNVDIIIPSYRPDGKLPLLIARLMTQTLPPRKIIIVNTDASQWQAELPENAPVELHHIAADAFNHGGTRNGAVQYSDAAYFVCMTQDAVPADDHLLENLLRPLDEYVKLSYARQLPAEDADAVERVTREFNYPADSFVKDAQDTERLGIKTYFCSNVCAAYERETFDRLGGFTETDFNEDMIYASKVIKSGFAIAYCADAQVLHSHNLSGWQQLQRNRILARSQKNHPEVFEKLKSESEGIRLVKTSAGKLLKEGRWYCIPRLIWVSGCKFIGYRIGKL